MLGDGRCDAECDFAACGYDGGDCTKPTMETYDFCISMAGGPGYQPFDPLVEANSLSAAGRTFSCLTALAGGGISWARRRWCRSLGTQGPNPALLRRPLRSSQRTSPNKKRTAGLRFSRPRPTWSRP